MKSTERSPDPVAARALNERMSAISEKYWCAAWLRDLEHSLWAMLEGGSRRFGLGDVAEDELSELRELAQKANGWWRWSEPDGDEVFVALEEWRELARAPLVGGE